MLTPIGKNKYQGITTDGKLVKLARRFDGKWRLTVSTDNTVDLTNLWDFEDFYTAREFVKLNYLL